MSNKKASKPLVPYAGNGKTQTGAIPKGVGFCGVTGAVKQQKKTSAPADGPAWGRSL